jgi:hypothetical protein
MTRDGQDFPMIWVLVDMTHPRAENLVTAAETTHAQKCPEAQLSVNRNVANTQALVKIACTEAELRARLTGQVEAAILRIYTEVDHAEAVALVSSTAWTG